MTNITSRLLPVFFTKANIIIRNFKTLAVLHGQWKSIRSLTSVDAKGNPIPWYTYPAIEYLNNFDFTKCDVFEFGSGNSSIYWSLRSKSVVSVEDNQEWYEIIRKKMRDNQTLIHRAEEVDYVEALAEQHKEFDIIIIDGNHRLSCTVEAIKFISENGMIILDNSDRNIEKECGKLLRRKGFIQVDFSGFGPINGYCWTTSVFLKTSKIISENYSGPNPVGGLKA